MLILADVNDKLSLISSSNSNLDVVTAYVDCSDAVPPIVQDVNKQLTAIAAAATTTDIVAAPGANKRRNVKMINVRNRHATQACDVTIQLNDNATLYELHKVTMAAGDCLEYVEGIGFFTIKATSLLDKKLLVTADVINATTSFADITGLTVSVEAGKHYNFEACLFHIENAATTGARFGINGPAMTAMRGSGFSVFAGSITAATFNAPTGDVTAVDTSMVAVTTSSAATPQVVPAIISGWINPSAAGTFAVRSQSEVAVGAGVTVKAGSWCRIWETPA